MEANKVCLSINFIDEKKIGSIQNLPYPNQNNIFTQAPTQFSVRILFILGFVVDVYIQYNCNRFQGNIEREYPF